MNSKYPTEESDELIHLLTVEIWQNHSGDYKRFIELVKDYGDKRELDGRIDELKTTVLPPFTDGTEEYFDTTIITIPAVDVTNRIAELTKQNGGKDE